MKRTYLMNAGNRITEFHEQGEKFQSFIEETIRELEQVIRTAQEEIAHFTKLRQAVNLTITNETLMRNQSPNRASVKMPPASNGSLDDDLQDELETNLRDMAPPTIIGESTRIKN